jgi:hypothetical protein
MDVYTTLGRLFQDYQSLREEYRKLLVVALQLKVGEVKPEQVTIDLPGLTWQVNPEQQKGTPS